MKLRVLASFRDISNFALRHEVGDMVEVSDRDRAAHLISSGLCEAVEDAESPRCNEDNNTTDITVHKTTRGRKGNGAKANKE